MERFLVVLFPLRAKDFCTVRGAVITVIFMATTNLVLHLYNLWGFELTPEGQCDVDNDMSDFMVRRNLYILIHFSCQRRTECSVKQYLLCRVSVLMQ